MARATFEELENVMQQLRAKCPWDKEQTFDSLRQFVLEEAYEVVDAIDLLPAGSSAKKEKPAPADQKTVLNVHAPMKLADELGDLLFQVVFLSELGKEKNWFDAGDVIGGIKEKLIRRHPHVFGDVQVETSKDVLTNWEAIKHEERKASGATSAMDGVSNAMPSLARAEKIGSRAARSGFDWRSAAAVLDKVEEELAEVRAALDAGDKAAAGHELGDLLFAAAQAARFLGLNPEEEARGATDKFEERYRHLEKTLAAQGKTPKDVDDAALDHLWQQAKAAIGTTRGGSGH